MFQSLANIVIRLAFSTKARHLLPRDKARGQLQAYIAGILENHESPLIAQFRSNLACFEMGGSFF